MVARDPRVAALVQEVLAGSGTVGWKAMLQHLLGLKGMRQLTQELGLTPKGFRVDRAPAGRLVELLAGVTDSDQVERIVGALVDRLSPGEAAPPAPAAAETERILGLRESELATARGKLHRAEEGAGRMRERAAELDRLLAVEREEVTRLRVIRQQLERRVQELSAGSGRPTEPDRQTAKQLVDLQRDVAALSESEAGLRRLLALRDTRIRDLERQVEGLEALIPASRRRKQKPMDELPATERRFIVPWFQPGFYRSLEGKDRKAVERAFQAVFLFCTEGHGYPGLETKALGGTRLWSVRASLKLRVYLAMRDDGDVDVIALADREDQDTMIKRLASRTDP